jgi:hypothetical protein
MTAHQLATISTNIRVCQNKLGLLRSELYRMNQVTRFTGKDVEVEKIDLNSEIEALEAKIDHWQKAVISVNKEYFNQNETNNIRG